MRTCPHFFIYMEENEKKDGKIYEIAYLFVPTIDESQIAGKFGDLKALLEKEGATFVAEEMPKMIDLAYTMHRVIANKKIRFNNAYFGWIKFELDPANVAALKPTLDRNEEVLRYMIIKTVRENTIASKKPMGASMMRRRAPEKKEGEEAAPINPEELDKQIEALVEEEPAA